MKSAAACEVVSYIIESFPVLQKISMIMHYLDCIGIDKMAEYLECSEETALRRLRKAERNICVQMDDRGMGKAFSENSEIVIHRALELMEERTVLSEEKAEWLYNEIIEREDIF